MKRNGVWIIAILIALLLGLLIGRRTGPDPTAGLVLDDSRDGCYKVAVERGSKATFLIVEVVDGETGPTHFVSDKEGQREKEICVDGAAPQAGTASDSPDEPHIVVFGLTGAAECLDGLCQAYEDYPLPWPPPE